MNLKICIKCILHLPVLLAYGISADAAAASGEASHIQDRGRPLCTVTRTVPDAGDHPGNVFLEGETVTITIRVPAGKEAGSWRILNDTQKVVKQGACTEGVKGAETGRTVVINAGTLPIGWYRIECLTDEKQCASWTTSAVLSKLTAPVPQDSPVCVDSATSWFAGNKPREQAAFARLAALCGVNWIRDRLRWRDIQPEPDALRDRTTYDHAAEIQTKQGLKVVQVFHDTPPWAVSEGSTTGRFVTDLRILYDFCKHISGRFQGKVHAWEPWNEANVENFGGHTAAEICAFQKAAYLGFKAGAPDVTVCWNVTTGAPTELHTETVLRNETWPYFDTYNIHTYDWPHSYEQLWEPARRAACGRPIWVTESDRGIAYEKGSPHRDLARNPAIRKAEFMAHSYAQSLHAGADRHFHFILGQYSERTVQFGLLRFDKTPRPAYSALAACGRFLAGARCLGRVALKEQPDVYVFAFRGRPDGKKRDVLVAWTETQKDWPERGRAEAPWPLPRTLDVEAVYDYLGRYAGKTLPETITSKALFIVLAEGAAGTLRLEKPGVSPFRKGIPSKVVIQPALSRERCTRLKEIPWAWEYIHRVPAETTFTIPLYVYNFGEKQVSGKVYAEKIPEGWTLAQQNRHVKLNSKERIRLTISVTRRNCSYDKKRKLWVQLRGSFGAAGNPVAAFPLLP